MDRTRENAYFIQLGDLIPIGAHLAIVLVAQFLQSLLQFGFVLLGEHAIDFADFDLPARFGFRQFLLVDLVLEGELLAQTLDGILQINSGQRFLFQVLPERFDLLLQASDFLFQFLKFILGLLALGQDCVVLGGQFVGAGFLGAGIAFVVCGFLGLPLQSEGKKMEKRLL